MIGEYEVFPVLYSLPRGRRAEDEFLLPEPSQFVTIDRHVHSCNDFLDVVGQVMGVCIDYRWEDRKKDGELRDDIGAII